jgi:hypothetical protein
MRRWWRCCGGARQVDAVEIDPVLVGLSRDRGPSAVYIDPPVRVHVDGARAFLGRSAAVTAVLTVVEPAGAIALVSVPMRPHKCADLRGPPDTSVDHPGAQSS